MFQVAHEAASHALSARRHWFGAKKFSRHDVARVFTSAFGGVSTLVVADDRTFAAMDGRSPRVPDARDRLR